MQVRKAVIVAAGIGSRLGKLTENLPKCLLRINGQTLIEIAIQKLKSFGVSEFGIVVGYQREMIADYLGDAYTYIYNPFFRETNNMGSLWFAKDFIGDDDFIYSHADLLYDRRILELLFRVQGQITLMVEEKPCDREAMKVKADQDLNFIMSNKEIELNESFGEWTGIARFQSSAWKKYLRKVEELLAMGKFNVYDTAAMNLLVSEQPAIIKVVAFKNIPWIEIDFAEDFQKAQNLLE